MEIEYQLSEEDIFTLTRYRLLQTPGRRNPVQFRRVSYAIGFMLFAIGNWILFRDIASAFFFLGLAVAFFLLYPKYFDWLLRRRIKSTYRSEKMRAALEQRTLAVNVEGLEEKSSLGESKIKWDAIDEIKTLPTCTIILIQNVPSIIIPKKQIITGNYNDFVQTCRQFFDTNKG